MRQGKPSEIPGAPPAGVSQPLDPRKGGGYIPLERSNTSLGEARTIMHGQPKQRRKATPWPTKTAKRAQPRRAPRPAPQMQQVPEQHMRAADPREVYYDPSQQQAPVEQGFVQPPPMNAQKGRPKLPIPADVVPLHNKRRAGVAAPLAEFQSVDGNTYVFNKMSSGSKNPMDTLFDIATASLIAHIEMLKGGSPVDVLEAFKVNLKDAEGELYFDWRDADYFRDLSYRQTVFSPDEEFEEDESEYEGSGGIAAYFDDGDEY